MVLVSLNRTPSLDMPASWRKPSLGIYNCLKWKEFSEPARPGQAGIDTFTCFGAGFCQIWIVEWPDHIVFRKTWILKTKEAFEVYKFGMVGSEVPTPTAYTKFCLQILAVRAPLLF